MKYGIRKSTRFKKSLRKMLKRGKDIKKTDGLLILTLVDTGTHSDLGL